MIRNLYNFILIFCISSTSFAGTLGKSHSAELLSRGRYIPIAISEDYLVTAKNFSSLSNREVDIYSFDKATNQFSKIRELLSPNPESGDDFGFSIAS